jgi:AcrR family transcriptional regulator
MGKQPSRADRILDAAGSLLLRYGYRKVTIEDVARQAGIGKGTVYLHWRTKLELFDALLRRESLAMIEEVLARLRADPAEAQAHRLVRGTFLTCLRAPLVMALVTGDSEVLGQLRDSPHAQQDQAATDQTLEILTRHGLLRDDVPNLQYALACTQNGFYQLEGLGETLDQEAKADALAHVIRAAFEPSGKPSRRVLSAAATELGALYENVIGEYQKWLYSDDDGETS